MTRITPQDAAAYLARWRQANRQEVAELRSATIEQKFLQLCALAASRAAFAADPDRDRRAADVAARWRRIRDLYVE